METKALRAALRAAKRALTAARREHNYTAGELRRHPHAPEREAYYKEKDAYLAAYAAVDMLERKLKRQ